MRGSRTLLTMAFACLCSIMPGAGVAQVSLFAGGAASLPLAEYGDVAEVGYQASIGAVIGAESGGLVLGAKGFYGANSHRIEGDRSNLYGLTALAGYRLGEAYGIRLTMWGGLGAAVHRRKSDTFPGLDASQRGLTASGGVTLARPLGQVSVFASGFYLRGLGDLGSPNYPTELVAIGGGVAIPLGID